MPSGAARAVMRSQLRNITTFNEAPKSFMPEKVLAANAIRTKAEYPKDGVLKVLLLSICVYPLYK